MLFKKCGCPVKTGCTKRNPQVSLRQPEGVSLNRINAEEVKIFLIILKKSWEDTSLSNTKFSIWMKQHSSQLFKKMSKNLCRKRDKKYRRSNFRGKGLTITGVYAASATGVYVPPMLIYPCQWMNLALGKNGPPGAKYCCSKNGWINTEFFTDVFATLKSLWSQLRVIQFFLSVTTIPVTFT